MTTRYSSEKGDLIKKEPCSEIRICKLTKGDDELNKEE
jgi:hypothetical protein